MIINPGVSGGSGKLRLIASGESINGQVSMPSPATYIIAVGANTSYFIPPIGTLINCTELYTRYTLSQDGMTLTMESATATGNWYAYGY